MKISDCLTIDLFGKSIFYQYKQKIQYFLGSFQQNDCKSFFISWIGVIILQLLKCIGHIRTARLTSRWDKRLWETLTGMEKYTLYFLHVVIFAHHAQWNITPGFWTWQNRPAGIARPKPPVLKTNFKVHRGQILKIFLHKKNY